MTDREMLELAAKAAGKRIVGWNAQHGVEVAVLEDGSFWQPIHKNHLTDCDGDAQRLVVKLQLHVINDGFVCVCRTEIHRNIGVIESLSNDPEKATRLAITRAAAEIGRNMK